MRKLLLIIGLLIVIGTTSFLVWQRYDLTHQKAPIINSPSQSLVRELNSPTVSGLISKREVLLSLPEAHIADNLNSPNNTQLQDIAIINSIFYAWRLIYSKTGNPVGNNQDIVRSLVGNNPKGIIFLQPNNPAINKNGDLCDRFGHPFFFHAKSGTQMEIRSAGPDGIMFTKDDVFISP
jgi:hypothetical protein